MAQQGCIQQEDEGEGAVMATTTRNTKGKGSRSKQNKPRPRKEYRGNRVGRSAGGIVLLVFGILLTIGGVIYLADVATVGALLPGMPAAVYVGPIAALMGGLVMLIIAIVLLKED